MNRALLLAALAVALGLGLATPVQADQTFWTYSSGPTPKHTATPNPYTSIYYSYPYYYSCWGDGRSFNPYGPFNPYGSAPNPSLANKGSRPGQYGHGCGGYRPGPRPRPTIHPPGPPRLPLAPRPRASARPLG